jgi:Ca2+-binding EF-hand superfamily protein
MFTRPIAATATAVLTLLLATAPARAETEADMSFDGMVKMVRMDKNKDGRVSRKEFLDRMSTVWDMRARKATMKDGTMSAEDFEKMVLMYLKAGG